MSEWMTIGERIQKKRKEIGMSQAKLARAIGVTRASMSQIESGQTKSPAASTLLLIAATLNASPTWIITGKGPEELRLIMPAESELVETIRKLTPENMAALSAAAQALLNSQQ